MPFVRALSANFFSLDSRDSWASFSKRTIFNHLRPFFYPCVRDRAVGVNSPPLFSGLSLFPKRTPGFNAQDICPIPSLGIFSLCGSGSRSAIFRDPFGTGYGALFSPCFFFSALLPSLRSCPFPRFSPDLPFPRYFGLGRFFTRAFVLFSSPIKPLVSVRDGPLGIAPSPRPYQLVPHRRPC